MQCWDLGVLPLVTLNHAWKDHHARRSIEHLRCFHSHHPHHHHHHHRARLHFFLWQWIPLVHGPTGGKRRREWRVGARCGRVLSVRASRLKTRQHAEPSRRSLYWQAGSNQTSNPVTREQPNSVNTMLAYFHLPSIHYVWYSTRTTEGPVSTFMRPLMTVESHTRPVLQPHSALAPTLGNTPASSNTGSAPARDTV